MPDSIPRITSAQVEVTPVVVAEGAGGAGTCVPTRIQAPTAKSGDGQRSRVRGGAM